VPRSAVLVALAVSACSNPADSAAAPSYDRYRQPERVVAALGLAPGQRVADVGAGRGYLTFRVAEAVGRGGLVVATDVDDGALDALRAHRVANVVARKVAPDDPGLEAGAYDVILLAEVDQYLPDRVAYLTRLRAALAPRGRVVVVNRMPFRAPTIAAAERAGYAIIAEVSDLPGQFLVTLEIRR
jgi:predicted methyltransferase